MLNPLFSDIEEVPPVSLSDHTRWKFLINTDGVAASARLGKLLAMNSVMLDYESPFIEYYYRSLKPGVHFLSINENNVLKTIKDASKDDEALKKIVANAQEFALRWETDSSHQLLLLLTD